MPAVATRWTPDLVRVLPADGNRYECLGGSLLVTPAPRYVHQYAVLELARALAPVVAEAGDLALLLAPADIELGGDLLQPDLFVVDHAGRPRPSDAAAVRAVVLVIEITSPTTARVDRGTKRERYQRAGIPEYWIVDLDARLIERWRPMDERPEILAATLHWTPRAGGPALDLDLPALLSRVLDG